MQRSSAAFLFFSKPLLSPRHPLPGLTRELDQCGDTLEECEQVSSQLSEEGREGSVQEQGKEATAAQDARQNTRSSYRPTVPGGSWPSLPPHGHTERQYLLKAVLSPPPAAVVRQNWTLQPAGLWGENSSFAGNPQPQAASHWAAGVLLLPRVIAALGSKHQLAGMNRCCWS